MIRQFGRFLVAGGAAVSVDFLTFLALRWLGAPLLAANTAAFCLALITGFTINRYWTFQAAQEHGRPQLVRYVIVALLGLILNTTVLATLVAVAVPEIIAKVAATAASAVLNFILSRTWVFKRSEGSAAEGA